MTGVEFEAAMSNWARWAQSTQPSGDRCRSLESGYRSPQTWHAEEPHIEVDVLDAERIEYAVVSLPPNIRHLIVYAYLTPNIDIHSICRRVGIRVWHFQDKLDGAKKALARKIYISQNA